MRKTIDSVIYSFPLQLVFHHIRRNLALVILWILFIVTVSGGIGKIYGIHYLYLDPEYVGRVDFWSFFLVGLAYGNFTMAYHITCYILGSHRFAFVGILERPFTKFSLNNSLIPLVALIIYVVLIVRFQISNEFSGTWSVIFNVIGLLLGISMMLTLFFVYFKFTNKDIFRFLAGSVDKRLRKSSLSRQRMMHRLNETRDRRYKVDNYFDLKLRLRSCSSLMHFYDKESVLKVFDQNHFNSVVIELIFILLILTLGAFMDNPYFQIPAAASSLLMFSIIVMLIGAFSFWLKGWGLAFVLGLFLLANVLVEIGVIKSEYHARGLIYNTDRVQYDLRQLETLNSAYSFTQDSLNMIKILDAWKRKQNTDRPQAIFQCVSGGGQRAALWTVNALQKCDSILDGELSDKTVLITGASGGIIGAAYYREMYYQKKKGLPIPSDSNQLQAIARDNLNAIIFSLLVNDAFFRLRTYDYAGSTYKLDRGHVFEQSLNKNLDGVLDKRLEDYLEPEKNAQIPLLLMSPVISNDGRKLYLSPHPTSFMNTSLKEELSVSKVRGVSFNQLFKNQNANDLSFLTALRMSASFPYITPTISLPSEPTIEIMDAGISDNYGVWDAVRFLYVFREWFEANTSGIVFLMIRDTRKNAPIEAKSNQSLVQKLTYPIASVYNNLGNIQDINNDAQIEIMHTWLDLPVETVSLEYNTYTNIEEEYMLASKALERKQLERASLSWHLTTKEKQNILENIELKSNQEALKRLDNLFH